MRRLHARLGLGWLVYGCVVSGLTATACHDTGAPGQVTPLPAEPVDGASDFTSQLRAGTGAGQQGGAGLESAAASDAATAVTAPTFSEDVGSGAQRAISEADILQLSGDRLYALSRYSGLSIIDVSDPAVLRMEGVYRSAAEPFEMYVEDGIVFAMFNGWGSYVCDEQALCSWQSSSRMQALDTRDPQNIRVITDQQVPGMIADSRRVGDILYLATEQQGYCWGCEAESNTTVTSFDVSDPTRFAQVDQLRLPTGTYTSEHSISVTDQRIYIAGQEWGNQGPLPSAVQVVDISDPSGALVQGGRFEVAGMITNRWQMDEYQGILRVISQPGGWGTDQPPVVETFRVASASDIQLTGSLRVRLPRPNEVLQSVRFDGTRGYAITAERRDPLFTFDLSDPARPLQLGELEMPGWVYHMEPRGNRVYALGYDPENPEGALHVSLFDVTDLQAPSLLSRVAFGGDWGSFAEGQDQIHKAFTILDDAGLILVPFSGGSYDELTCEYDYGSGIQLVDFTDASLSRRGVAPQIGNARRAFLHRDHLFGVGDNSVQSFDIADRDAPLANGQLDVARNVSTVRVLGDHLLRFGNDWATQQTILDMTPVALATTAEPTAEIDLSALFGEDAWSCNSSTSWGRQVFTRGNYAYVPRYTYRNNESYSQSEQRLALYIVDLSDRAAPRAAGRFDVAPALNGEYFTDIAQTDDTLLVGRARAGSYDARGRQLRGPSYHYDVIELSDPVAPSVAQRIEVPEQIAGGGWGQFVGDCSIDMAWGWYGGGYGASSNVTLSDGDLVVSQHSEAVPGAADQVKYYLDRIDVSDPYHPTFLPKINIPGTAIHFEAASGELITLDYAQTVEAAAEEQCWSRGHYAEYYAEPGKPLACHVWRRSIESLLVEGERAVRQSHVLLDRTERTGQVAVSDSRIFYTTTEFPEASASVTDYASPSDSVAAPTSAVTLESLRLEAGQLTRLPSQELRREPNGGYASGMLFARGDRAFEIHDNSVTVVDTVNPESPRTLTHGLSGWTCQSLEVAEDTAYCALGERGLETIDLTPLR